MKELKLLKDKKLSELAWPEGLNLDVLFQLLGEKVLLALLDDCSEQSRKERRIILPNRQTVIKVICYHLGEMVEQKKCSWDDIKILIQEELGALKELGIKLHEVQRLHAQRKKELEKEKMKEEQRISILAAEARTAGGAPKEYWDKLRKGKIK